MHSSKLLKIIQVFDDADLKTLGQFIKSALYNQDKSRGDIEKLFNYLQAQAPHYPKALLTKAQVHTLIYPEESFKKSRIDLLMNKLLRIVKLFIVHQYPISQGGEIAESLAFAKFCSERNLTQQFELAIKSLWKKQQSITSRDSSFYYNDFLINQEIVLFNSLYNQKKDDLNILQTIKSLDIYYVVTKLEYTCALLSASKETSIDLEDSIVLLKTLSPLIEKGSLAVPLVKVYYQAFLLLLLKGTDEAIYDKYRNLLKHHQAHIPTMQLKGLQAHARNYCIFKYNNGGREEDLFEVFELFKEHLEEGFLYYNDGLLPSTFQTIVRLGLKLKAYDWIKNFLDKYQGRIVGTQHPEEVYHFNLANYYFSVQAYDKALDYLAGNYENTYYTIFAKCLEIKIYYETKSVLLDAKILNFKLFIFRNRRISKEKKEANNNFIDVLKQINHHKTKGNQKRINSIKTKIQLKKRIAEKEWILEQLELLR